MPTHIEVAAVAHANVLETLRRFGNAVSPAHDEALRLTLLDLAGLAYGVIRGRRAYPLSCGLGKTQSIVAFCGALEALPLNDIALVTASALFDLCSEAFIESFARHLADANVGLYAALTYVGEMTWSAPHPLDEAVRAAFTRTSSPSLASDLSG